jgi:predicted enzyme related to lactoylglutathione lyase
VSDDDDADEIQQKALDRGATELWRHHFWAEFNGFSNAFIDPWGNEIVLWTKAGDDPEIPEGWTRE